MADIRVQIPDEFMDRLRNEMQLKTNTDVIQEAITILSWAVEERERGRLILSTDSDGEKVERLAMRSLAAVRAKSYQGYVSARTA